MRGLVIPGRLKGGMMSKHDTKYGSEYEPEADDLKWWEKCLLVAGIVFALVMCAMLKGQGAL